MGCPEVPHELWTYGNTLLLRKLKNTDAIVKPNRDKQRPLKDTMFTRFARCTPVSFPSVLELERAAPRHILALVVVLCNVFYIRNLIQTP